MMTSLDPIYKQIRDLRDTYGADLVGMITSNRATSCGCGSLPLTWNVPTDELAYFVSTVQCATFSYTFAHEIGHAFVSAKMIMYYSLSCWWRIANKH